MNSTTSDVLDAGLGEQLEPPLERREQLDAVAEHEPRVRVERDDRRREPGRDAPPRARGGGRGGRRRTCRSRPRAACGRAPRRRVRDPHREPRAARVASTGTIRSSSASSTRERADLGAPQRAAVPAERVRDRADVGARARRAGRAARRRPRSRELERVDARAPERHLDRHPAPVQPVGALAADLHRRGGRDRQLDLAAERRRAAARAPPAPAARAARRPRPRDRRSTSGRRGRSPSGSACRGRRSSARPSSPGPREAAAARSRTGRACRRGPSAPRAGAGRR